MKKKKITYLGLLQPLSIIEIWKDIDMDFIGLPKFWRNDTIIVIIDRFTKYEHFILLAHSFKS